jgi:hypothetical protein
MPGKRRRLLVLGPILLVLVIPLVLAFRIQRREAAISHGVKAEATVLGIYDTGDTDYLTVSIGGACGCTVEIAIANLRDHPVGSRIPVQYDPSQPSRAKALVDRPHPYEPILPLASGIALALVILGPLLLLASRRRRRSLALVRATTPSMRARVEAWQRPTSNAILGYYLSVYPAGSPEGIEPLVCVQTDIATIDKLRAGQTFDLYTDLQNGIVVPGRPLALKDGDVVIAASAKTRSGSWETGRRAPQADIAPSSDDFGGPRIDVQAGSLFADGSQARAWQRNATQLRLLLPLLFFLPIVRIVPEDLIFWALPVLGIVLVAQ